MHRVYAFSHPLSLSLSLSPYVAETSARTRKRKRTRSCAVIGTGTDTVAVLKIRHLVEQRKTLQASRLHVKRLKTMEKHFRELAADLARRSVRPREL